MSRRPAPNPAAERAAQNQQTIKSLLKLETNKVCADCKRNKHPRWASWNLGVFICIRCSGIHRGMGTHISRVKSVDLDSWTDEQLQSIMSWGNARANKYWEAKLAPGHQPSEPKIENFIRTKYELKRWVMDGPIPDPATLDVDGDDDIPLSIVKEKQTIDRKESIRKASLGKTGAPGAAALLGSSSASSPTPKSQPAAPAIDLFGGSFDDAPTSSTPPPRASTAGPTGAHAPPKAENAPPKAANTKDSLLGLDFFGSAQPAVPARPSSTTGSAGSGAQSRPDLKQSILSLYATAPRVQQQQPQQQGGFGSMASPGQNAGSGFVDAFSSLSFSNTTPAATASPQPVDAFSGLASMTSSSTRSPPPAASSSAFGGLGGGSFFNTKPAAAVPPPQAKPAASSSAFGGLGGFDAFSSSPSPPAAKPVAAAAPSSNAFGDLFDFSPAPAAATPSQPIMSSSSMSPPPGASASMNSVFNLSQPAAASKPATSPPTATAAATSPLAAVSANWGNSDVWGSNDGWGSSAPAPAAAPAPATTSAFQNTNLAKASTSNDFGWGSSANAGTGGSFATQSIVPGAAGGFNPAPKVAADEEFGGWSSSAATPGSNGAGKSATGGFGANEDLFSNVWN
ncbi:ARF GAP with effector function(s) [Sporothrix bragantina]|uniref:ARF GAP with effector function(S) n=1 Tax=Sporothrix bragantina TaxID=671064 RepID=A0ABP0BJG4_9PEZI